MKNIDYSKIKSLFSKSKTGMDLHKITASEIFNTPINKVAKEQRKYAMYKMFMNLYSGKLHIDFINEKTTETIVRMNNKKEAVE